MEKDDGSWEPETKDAAKSKRSQTFWGLLAIVAVAAHVALHQLGFPLLGQLATASYLVSAIVIMQINAFGEISKLDEKEARQRRRSIAIAWALVGLLVLFLVATYVQFGSGGDLRKP